MRAVKLIALNTTGYLISRKTMYVLFFIALFVLLITGADLYGLFTSDPAADPKALLSRQASALSRLFGIWSVLSTFAAIIAAAGVVYSDTKSKIILGILAKPVARWQYLTGKWFGVLLFFYGFLATGLLIVIILMLIWGISFTGLFVTAVAGQLMILTVYSGIAFSLSLFIAPMPAGGISFIFFSFASQFEQLISADLWWASLLGSVLYYLQPAVLSDNILEKGLLNNLLDPDFSFYWSVIAENMLYAALIFFIAITFFQKKDIIAD